MSLMPLKSKENGVWYGARREAEEEETKLLVGVPGKAPYVEFEVSEVIVALFINGQHGHDLHEHPKTSPPMCPETRFKRHRNYYIWTLNQFRHWWKTSRLLVRLSGGYENCLDTLKWEAMGTYVVSKRKQGKMALRSMKAIGRGGPSSDFLKTVKPFTRSIRITLAVARAVEARVDNRLYEVGFAEAFAFMGNRCSRWVARNLVDTSTKTVLFPFSAAFIAPYLDQKSRPVIVTMGFIRAILPFAFSFIGSAIGRQLTFNTYKFANYRWQPVMSIMDFHQNEGVFQDIVLDPELEAYAHKIAVAIGHGKDPTETRLNLSALGFEVVGAGSGGLAVFRYELKGSKKVFILYITPYGPSILDEMPRYVVLERRHLYYTKKPDSAILEAAAPCEESIHGFTYSGAFFNGQEWAALTTRFELELSSYAKACSRLGTQRYLRRGQSILYKPPNDLATLKQFIRSGHLGNKMKKDRKRWKQIQAEVKKMAKMVEKYQKEGTAPKRVILYLEGLDCSAKSSTGGLICEALEDCGYGVKTAQHNRPPTPEQKQKPWMDRIRFEYPEDVYLLSEEIPEYAALVWDRGPGGDFVYGNFSELSQTEKKEKYEDFRTYDANCREEGVLFCKLLFVTDKDSIASTLGKRLAHKKIVQDLKTWLDANSVAHAREGLEMIEAHIDPTDFVAFNNYKQNLAKFTEFARNTDNVGHVGLQVDSTIGYNNPWNVVTTSKRHPARLALLQAFEKQLKRYATTPKNRISAADNLIGFFELDPIDDPVMRPFPNEFIEERDYGISFRAVLQSWLLVALLFFYAYITWKFDINDYT